MCHDMLTQRALFALTQSNTKKGTLSQQFVMHVAPPLGSRGVSLVCQIW